MRRRLFQKSSVKRRRPICCLLFATACSLLVGIVTIRLNILQRDVLPSTSISSGNESNNQSNIQQSSVLRWKEQAKPQPLEFVHITKTGGTAVEMAAANSGITWGVCHFQTDEGCLPLADKKDRKYPLKKRIPVPGFFGELWHTPPSWFVTSPYRGVATFTIVRNPYDRYISEFYCPHYGVNRPGPAMDMMYRTKIVKIPPNQSQVAQIDAEPKWSLHDGSARHPVVNPERGDRRRLVEGGGESNSESETPERFNRWLAMRLRGQSILTAHMMPQHLYVYDFNGKQAIDHVLKYETLQDDFIELMDRYELPVRLPKEATNQGKAGKERMTVTDLTADTIQLINDYAADDFRLLGYDMIDPGVPSERSM